MEALLRENIVIAMFLQTLRLARAADAMIEDLEVAAGVPYAAVADRMSPTEFFALVSDQQ